jgi:hypothetical protein
MKTTPDWPKNLNIYPYSLFYVFFEQYETIKGITFQNYMLSLTIVFCLVSVRLLVLVQLVRGLFPDRHYHAHQHKHVELDLAIELYIPRI